jgi:hypothetical protein
MKTAQNRLHAATWYLPFTKRNTEPTAIRNSGSVPVEMEGCEDMRFKQRTVTEFLAAVRISPIEIHAVCGQGMEINVLT